MRAAGCWLRQARLSTGGVHISSMSHHVQASALQAVTPRIGVQLPVVPGVYPAN